MILLKQSKDIEAVTRHDVKAVEYFIGNQLKDMGYDYLISFCSYWMYFRRY